MAMVQYKDDSFGDFIELEKFFEQIEQDWSKAVDAFVAQHKAVHFGTEQELKEVKHQATLSERMSALEKRVEQIEPVTSTLINLPSHEEILQFTKEEIKKQL